ncbi:MAG: YraN family protein, partial [Patescibacteria group bacterium]|nr:YraN family protein [Patescibacteria group bacterium]
MTKILGDKGEAKAIDFLTGEGYRVLARNYRNRFGEVDIIAPYGDESEFIEVKTRTGDS